MKATRLLKRQHKEVDQLFKRIEKSKRLSEKKSLFKQLATLLVAHDGIEREVFYPACEKNMGLTDDLGEALVEHGTIEFCLYQADEAGEADFEYKCIVLREIVEHHVEEEEKEFFPKVEKAFSTGELKILGEKMEEAFEKATKTDYHVPLHNNLRQVLEGALKTTKKAGNSSAKKQAISSERNQHPAM